MNCAACPVDTYLTETGKKSKADCVKCNTERSTGTTIGNIKNASCLCKRTDYYQDNDGTCIICPPGGDCSATDGLTLNKITAKKGYWKSQVNTTSFADCKSFLSDKDAEKRCIGGNITNVTDFNPDNQCLFGYGGPSCMACAESYVEINNECIYCNGGGIFVTALIPILCASVLLFLLVLLFIFVDG